MQKKETAIEVKVGALVLFSLGLLAAFVVALGDFSFKDGFEFHVQFDNAGGLKPGADVAIAGINVGSVTGLSFVRSESIEKSQGLSAVAVDVTIRLDSQYKDSIRTNSEFFITTRGVLGEPYIEVVTRSLEAAPIKNGQVLRGVDPPRMDLIVAKLSTLLNVVTDILDNPDVQVGPFLTNMSSLAKNVDGLVVSNRENIDGTLSELRTASGEASRLLATLNNTVGDGTQIRAVIDDAGATARNARQISERVGTRIDPVLGDVEASAQSVRNVTSSAERLLTRNEEKIASAIDNVHVSSDKLVNLSSDAQSVMSRVQNGEGTVGQLLADREIYEDMKEILRIIKRQPWKILWKE